MADEIRGRQRNATDLPQIQLTYEIANPFTDSLAASSASSSHYSQSSEETEDLEIPGRSPRRLAPAPPIPSDSFLPSPTLQDSSNVDAIVSSYQFKDVLL